MAKKLKKLSVGELVKNWKSLNENYLSFILENKKVHVAKIESFRNKIFFIKNTKGHSLKLHLQDISEVWQEIKAPGK